MKFNSDVIASYHGLYLIANGDYLTIFHPEYPDIIVWEGTIDLIEVELFTEDVLGFWLNTGPQRGEDKETWALYFLKEYFGVLETSPLHNLPLPSPEQEKKALYEAAWKTYRHIKEVRWRRNAKGEVRWAGESYAWDRDYPTYISIDPHGKETILEKMTEKPWK